MRVIVLSTEVAPESLNSQYAARVASDLARVTEEIERVEAQLVALRRDRALLERVRGSLQDAQETDSPGQDADQAIGRGPLLSHEPVADLPAPELAARGARPGRRRTRSGVSTLRDLVFQHLIVQRDPRSAGEVAASLAGVHPGRNMSVQLVRNAIESHVAQGSVVRSKQGRAVFYSTAEGSPTGSEALDDSAANQ